LQRIVVKNRAVPAAEMCHLREIHISSTKMRKKKQTDQSVSRQQVTHVCTHSHAVIENEVHHCLS